MKLTKWRSLYEQKYTIYCDLDGVLSDFNFPFEKYVKMPSRIFKDKHGEDAMWGKINEIDHFWLKMPLMKNANILWNYIKKYKPILLTTPAESVKQCKQDKLDWVKEKLGNYKVIFEKNKEKYATENSILIDDREDNIADWKSRGGIGILFKNAMQVISKLKELGL